MPPGRQGPASRDGVASDRAPLANRRDVRTMGLADAFLSAGHRIGGVNVHGERGRIAQVAFAMLETRYPFVLGVPQDQTERILEERLARLGVRVRSEEHTSELQSQFHL